MPKILFIIPPKQGWDGKLHKLVFPYIGVAYLSAYLKKSGMETSVLDTSLNFDTSEQDIADAIAEHRPDIIGLTVYSTIVNECQLIIDNVRKVTDKPIVAGGPHISVTGVEFLEKTGVEYGIRQDGEIPLKRLMETLFGGDAADVSALPGLIYRQESGEYAVNENSALIHDLDELPFPDWSIFDVDRYAHWRDRCYPVITSRGCPYGCTYCAAPLVTGRRFRARSAKNVVDEMEQYVKKGFKRFGIADDAFNIDVERAKEICRLIIDRELNIVWDMGNGIRANHIDRELAELLRKSGCNFIGIGLETGSPEMLKRIRKGLKLEQVDAALELTNEMGIGTAVNFIIGHPGETYETAMETLRVAERIKASYVNIYGLQPMKGTLAYDELKREEAEGRAHFIYEQDYYLSKFSGQGIEPVFETADLSAEQRRELLTMGRNITKKRAFKYRFGNALGTILYLLTRNDRIFNFVNNLRHTALGSRIYSRIRHES